MWNSLVGEPTSIDDERLMEWLGIDPKPHEMQLEK